PGCLKWKIARGHRVIIDVTPLKNSPPMIRDPRWDSLSDADWDAFARAWVAEMAGQPPEPLPELPVLFEDEPETTASAFVVPMNFTASAEAQWKFIRSLIKHADDDTLGHLAAGPVEHLLSKHGDEYIDRFEAMANDSPRFAQMLSGCYRHMMSDDVWARVCAMRGDPA
ncbi:MAG: DUF6869 domain-containing protein, partial [Candidatus Paceibacterota bacterium]